jgi:hypothetical protein
MKQIISKKNLTFFIFFRNFTTTPFEYALKKTTIQKILLPKNTYCTPFPSSIQ